MSFNHGDLVTLRGAHDGGRWGARYADWRGRITDVIGDPGHRWVDVEPVIPLLPGRQIFIHRLGDVTRVPEYFLEVVSRPKRPKSAAKGRQFFFDARTDMPPGVFDAFEERSRKARAALLRHVAEDRAYARARRDAAAAADDADFHDAADTREKTLSAAAQSDLAQARSKKKGGRGRRRRRKRTRRTRRRKKRRTRSRRRKRTRRRRRR